MRQAVNTIVPGYQVRLSFKRHFLPPLLGVLTMLAILAVFNLNLILARLNYARLQHTAASLSTNGAAVAHTPQADEIIIEKLGIRAPVIYDEPNTAEYALQKALRRGVVHYGTSSLPGQDGNILILGHSSQAPWAAGDYKFVFALLDKLQVGDSVVVNYQKVTYTYEVTGSEVVSPHKLDILQKKTGQPTLTLMTCVPVGTDRERLLVHARQISSYGHTAQVSLPLEPLSY